MITLKISRASLAFHVGQNLRPEQGGEVFLSIDENFSFGQFITIADDKPTREYLENAHALLIPIPAMRPGRNARFSVFCERFKPEGVPERKRSTGIDAYLTAVSRPIAGKDGTPRWPDADKAWHASECEDMELFIHEWRIGLKDGAADWAEAVRIYGNDSDYVEGLYGNRLLPAQMVKAQIPPVQIEFPELFYELADLAFSDMPQARWWTLAGAAAYLGVAENVLGNRFGRVTYVHKHLQTEPYELTLNDNKSAFHVRLKDKEAFVKAFGGLQFREDAWD